MKKQKYAIKVASDIAIGIPVGEQFTAEDHYFGGRPAVFVCVDKSEITGNRAARRKAASKRYIVSELRV